MRTNIAGGDPQIFLSVLAVEAVPISGLDPPASSTEPMAQPSTVVQFESKTLLPPLFLVGPEPVGLIPYYQ